MFIRIKLDLTHNIYRKTLEVSSVHTHARAVLLCSLSNWGATWGTGLLYLYLRTPTSAPSWAQSRFLQLTVPHNASQHSRHGSVSRLTETRLAAQCEIGVLFLGNSVISTAATDSSRSIRSCQQRLGMFAADGFFVLL